MLEFDKSGKLLKGMPDVIKKDDVISIKIPFDKSLFQMQIDSIRFRVLKAIVFWNDSVNVKKARNFLTNTDIDVFRNELNTFYNCISRPIDTLLISSGCNSNYSYLPNPRHFIDSLKIQYKVTSKCKGDTCLKNIPLTGPTHECENWCFTAACTVTAEDVNIEVYKINPVKVFIIDFYNSKLSFFNQAEWILATETKDSSAYKLFKYIDSINGLQTIQQQNSCPVIRDSINKLTTTWQSSVKYNYLARENNNLKRWLLSFAWLNNDGGLQLNPFNFTDRQFYSTPASPKIEIDTDFHIADSILNATIKAKRKLSNKDYNELILSIAKKDSLEKSSRSPNQADAALAARQQKMIEANAQLLAAIQQTGIYLNNVKAPVFNYNQRKDRNDTIHLRNYYYKQQIDKRKFKYLYPENEKILLPVHNVPHAYGISIEEKFEKYAEQPQIVTDGLSFLESASSLFSLLKPFSGIGKELSANLFKNLSDTINNNSNNNESNACSVDMIKVKINSINNYRLKYKFIDSIKSLSQIPPLALSSKMTDTPIIRTVVITPEVSESPTKYLYKLTAVVDTTVPKKAIMLIDSSYYRVGKLRFTEFAAGIAYSFSSVRITKIDTTGNKFNISNDEDRIRLVLGLKFHFKKIFWGDNRFVLNKNKLRDGIGDRLFGFIGISLPKPLDNFYTGGGIDLIPGLSINAGAQWYRNRKYAISNNQIQSQSFQYRPAFFMGVTTDPTLLAAVLKTIIKP
jgi:hypothetical protein